MKTVKELLRDERFADARVRLRELVRRTDVYAEFHTLSQLHKRLMTQDSGAANRRIKVALLGLGTMDFIEPALALALETWELTGEIRRAAYNTYAQEMIDAGSETARFKPDVAVVVNSPMHLPVRPSAYDSQSRVAALVHEVTDYWLGLCSRLHDSTGCEVILDNFHLMPARPTGNLASKLPWDLNTFLRRVNLELGERAPSFLHINDVDTMATVSGLHRWFDARHWYQSKLPVSLVCQPIYAKSIAGIIGAIYGKTAKCLVLDLDNTLWGGIVGDDGVDGINIGQGDAVGEAFQAFQRHLLELKGRGVMLAVCSKNEEEHALAPFQQHPEMVLKRNDFVAFKANWQPKPENLRAIARDLNIGLDSMVFVDDNPRERDQVRQYLPEVRVVELTDDVSEYPHLLDATGWFEVVRLSAEDATRTEQYRANELREQDQKAAGNYATYLAGLNQIAVVAPYDARFLDRISQLVNKTNQFNLTTRRQSRFEVEQEMSDPSRLTAYVRLADRFGDNGLISVFSSVQRGRNLEIDQWLMSCRVFNRGVEHLLFNWIAERARALGVETVYGTFVPTAKNSLTARLYASLGFVEADPPASGEGTRWRLDLDKFSPIGVEIKLVEDYSHE